MRKNEEKNRILTRELEDAFERFLERHSPEKVNRTLRKLLFIYLNQEDLDRSELDDVIFDLEGLMDLMDSSSPLA